MKGRKERVQDEGCVGRSQVASKGGGVEAFFSFFFPFVSVLCVWLVVVGRRLGWLWTVTACLALWGSWLLQFLFLICFGASFLCVWLVAVGVWSGWAPPSRREQDEGRCVEQEPGKMCCGSEVSCEWPGVGWRLRGQVPGPLEKGGRFNFCGLFCS